VTAPPVTSKVEAKVISRPPPTTTTTSCALSHNPSCGPMYFDPAPGADQPLRVGLTASPAHPAAGQTVTFHLVLDDADGPIGCLQRISDGVTTTVNDCGTPAPCDRYGAWPPPQPAPAHKQQDIPITYTHAGTYTFAVSVQPYTPSCVDARTHRGDQPYSSAGSGSLTITVS
jgi:hypothetical protein